MCEDDKKVYESIKKCLTTVAVDQDHNEVACAETMNLVCEFLVANASAKKVHQVIDCIIDQVGKNCITISAESSICILDMLNYLINTII